MVSKRALVPFTHGEVKPAGWLLGQLRIQAQGLSGNLDKVWPDIRDSRWIGGDRDGWERVPYWLDGFIPLAYLLDDDDLKARAKRYVDGILDRQEDDGWICPCPKEQRGAYDMWALILILKVLAMYGDLSGDERIQPAVEAALKNFGAHIRHNTIFDWAATRWYEALIPIFWLYERTGEPWLIELAHRLQAEGVDYKKIFDPYLDQEPYPYWTFLTHVVNLGMALKQEGLVSRMSGGDADAFALKMHETLLKYHGMAVGHFTGDECVSGDSPVQGSELCSVVEAMYSFEELLAVGGNPHWGDACERLAFNALPATNSPDMWTHQYVQMTNQVRCSRLPEGHVVFRTNGPEAHVFGLEPNYGCCTANFNQGWPKFAMATFMKTENGVASALIAPSSVTFKQGDADVCVTLETDYPFRACAKYTVTASAPVEMELSLRIPGFAKSATVDGQPAVPGAFHTITKTWSGTTSVDVQFRFEAELVDRPRDMRALWRGPLLYSVAIEEEWKRVEYEHNGVERKYPYCDYAISPKSAWNYGFAGDSFEAQEKPVGDCPFSPDGAPVEIMAQLAEIDWPEQHGICAVEPQSRKPLGAARAVRMIPYGCTNLRMTEMPVVEK